MIKMELVLKAVYGLDTYNANNQPNSWLPVQTSQNISSAHTKD
jgi:hypothetical protein